MKKLLVIAVLIGGAVFAGIYFFSNKESTPGSLNKALSDNYSAFTSLAGYMRAHPDTAVIYKKDVKGDPSALCDFEQIEAAGILCVWNKQYAVAFDTGKETQSSNDHYIIYSPSGKPADFPKAFSADKKDWYIC